MRKTKIPGIMDLGAGRYRIRAVVRTRAGERRELIRIVHCDGMGEAQRRLLDLKEQLAGEPPQRSRLGAVAQRWLAERLAARRPDGTSRLAPSTAYRYRHTVEQLIVPYLGEIPFDRLTARELERWRDHLAQHYASQTVNGALQVLRTLLRDAGTTVGERIRALRGEDERITSQEPNALTEEEVGRFLLVARTHYPQHYALILTLLTTAGRIGTVLALEWQDVDEQAGTITFRRRLSRGEVLEGVKRSRRAQDVVPLLPEVRVALREHRMRLAPELRNKLVFPSEVGGHHDRRIFKTVFPRILRLAQIDKRFTPHGCRRTAAALYRRAAGSVVAKAIAGHVTDRMHEHYAVVSTQEKRDAAQRAFRLVVGGGSEEVEDSVEGGGS